MRAIDMSIAVSVPCAALQLGKVQFPDVPELRQAVEVYGFEAYDDTDLAADPNGSFIIPAADMPLVTMTLVEESTEVVRNIPMSSLITRLNAGIWKETRPMLVNFQRSYITFGTTATFAAPFVVPFSFFYRRLDGVRPRR